MIGCGKALPALEVPNEELEKVIETNDEWITSRTGISSRRISVHETATTLAACAACDAMGLDTASFSSKDERITLVADNLEHQGWNIQTVDPESIDLIILTSVTPDAVVPSNACLVRRALGCTNAIAFDLNAACTGFIYALSVADAMLTAANTANTPRGNALKRALVVSTERLTRLTDWADRNTCVLFGDGAGAALLEWRDDADGILSTFLENTDDVENSLVCKNTFTSSQPFNEAGVIWDQEALARHRELHPDPKVIDYSYLESLACPCDTASDTVDIMLGLDGRDERAPEQVILMDGQRVFKFAARSMEKAIREAASLAGISLDELALIVPHQANLRIIEFAAKRLKMPLDSFQVSIQGTGNTSSSGVPMALTDALVSGTIAPGDLIALVAFGGGLTSGAAIMRV